MSKKQSFTQTRSSRQNRYFSESFKKKKVRELERNIVTVREISREYEVSKVAVYKWLYKYSTMAKKGVKQVIEPLSDTRKIQALKQQVSELERLIGKKQIALEFTEKMIELAEAHYQIEIKKKFGLKPYTGFGSTEKNTTGK